jgi:hypothetical protein
MALCQGGLARGATPDMANVIKLDSAYSANAERRSHAHRSPRAREIRGKAV